MRFLFFFLLAAGACFALTQTEKTFAQWQQQHGRVYRTDAERAYRLSVFEENVARVAKMNSENSGASFALNQFADMTHEEFKSKYLSTFDRSGLPPMATADVKVSGDLPNAWDWREHGAVNPIKDQAQCGSCWAFSAIANVEGQWFRHSGTLISLSEQALVSCDHECNEAHSCDSGCNGGLMDNAFRWVIKNGMQTEDDYPYTSGTGRVAKCKFDPSKSVAHFSNWTMVPSNEKKIQQYLYDNGPLSIAVDAENWSYYSSGIYDGACTTDLDHGVALVGYGSENGKDYWLVRNSWGTSWGMNGYMKLARGKNKCGVAEFVCSILY